MMIKKCIGITVLLASMMLLGCSSDDDDSSGPTGAGEPSSETNSEGEANGEGETNGEGGENTEDNLSSEGGGIGDGSTNTIETVFLEATEDYGNSVMGIVVAQPDTTLFESAILNAADDLDVVLNDSTQTWTIFVANDTAMEGVNADRAVLLQHIHSGFADEDFLTTLIGQDIGMTGGPRRIITLADDGVTLQIDGVNLVQSGIVGDNGVVHKIDGVLP